MLFLVFLPALSLLAAAGASAAGAEAGVTTMEAAVGKPVLIGT